MEIYPYTPYTPSWREHGNSTGKRSRAEVQAITGNSERFWRCCITLRFIAFLEFVHLSVSQKQHDVSASGSATVLERERSFRHTRLRTRPSTLPPAEGVLSGLLDLSETRKRVPHRTQPPSRLEARRGEWEWSYDMSAIDPWLHVTQTLRKWELVATAICGNTSNYTSHRHNYSLAHSATLPSHASIADFPSSTFLSLTAFWDMTLHKSDAVHSLNYAQRPERCGRKGN